MIAGGPELQLGVTQSSTASDISEIECPNLLLSKLFRELSCAQGVCV